MPRTKKEDPAQEDCWVVVVGYGDRTVLKVMGPHPRFRAEKIDRGLNINLDHARYYTLIVNEEPEVGQTL